MKETIAKINKTKSYFFGKVKKIDKPLARLIRKEREKTQINRIRNENGEVTTDTAEIQRIMRDYYEQLYNKLEVYSFPRLNQEEIENMNKTIMNNKIESIIKRKTPNKLKSRPR